MAIDFFSLKLLLKPLRLNVYRYILMNDLMYGMIERNYSNDKEQIKLSGTMPRKTTILKNKNKFENNIFLAFTIVLVLLKQEKCLDSLRDGAKFPILNRFFVKFLWIYWVFDGHRVPCRIQFIPIFIDFYGSSRGFVLFSGLDLWLDHNRSFVYDFNLDFNYFPCRPCCDNIRIRDFFHILFRRPSISKGIIGLFNSTPHSDRNPLSIFLFLLFCFYAQF